MDKRVVITGVGVVSSIGIGKDNFWSALIAGKSGISRITSFDTSAYPTHYGGEIKDFKPEDFLDKKKANQLGRASLLAIAAAKLGLSDAGIKLAELNPDKTGVVIGTTMGESQVLEKLNDAWVKNGVEAIDPQLIPRYPANVLSLNVAEELRLAGPNLVIPNACAAGNYAIGYACDLIQMDKAEVMLAGGTDAFSRIAFLGFNRLLAVAPEMCRPFDKNRKGMLVGEGAGIVVLEPLEAALKRQASIYAEVAGYGLSCDAHHMTAPFADGIKEAIEKALYASKIGAQSVDYFNAHGTGTPANDREECLAIKKVFGDYYKKLPVSSIKSMLGHTMGAASAIEAVACALSVKNDIIPPTINYLTPDPECDIDCVPNAARRVKVDVALNSASAFGGNNACLVLKKFPLN
ncbi:MAG: beta-ketoacyl-[acyl-carrier-protein] synthase family protein [Candidatus Omnitrophica bacterium]|nr:beta-ketoacyl-[acyl-carrier-protein] synthase family protein [Candidatus Omnitrophota bacterium]